MKIALAPATIALASLCGILGMVLLYEIAAPLSHYTLPEMTVRAVKGVVLAPAGPTLPPPEMFASIDARPLFDPSRKPAPRIEAADSAHAGPPPAPNATLVGIIIDSSQRIALIRSPASPLAQSFVAGAAIGAWNVSSIEPDHVVLRVGTFEQRLDLNSNRAPSGQSQGVVPQDPSQTAMSP